MLYRFPWRLGLEECNKIMQTIQKGQRETQTANQKYLQVLSFFENFSWLKPRTVWHAINFLRPGWHTQFTNTPLQFAEPCCLPLYPSCSRGLRSPLYGDQSLREEEQWDNGSNARVRNHIFWLSGQSSSFSLHLQTICAPFQNRLLWAQGKSEKDCLLVGSLLNSTVELNYGENYCLRIPRSNIERDTRTHPYIHIILTKSARVAFGS